MNSIVIFGVAAFFLYPFGMRLLARRIQPQRLEMADLGVRLIKSSNINNKQRTIISSMLRDAFDYRVAIMLVIGAPLVVLGMVFGKVDLKSPLPETPQFERLRFLHVASIAAANPVFFVILIVELLVLTLFWCPAKVLRRKYSGAHAVDILVSANKRIDRHLGYLA